MASEAMTRSLIAPKIRLYASDALPRFVILKFPSLAFLEMTYAHWDGFTYCLCLAHVCHQGQRDEYDRHGNGAYDRQPKVIAYGPLIKELPDRAHDIG